MSSPSYIDTDRSRISTIRFSPADEQRYTKEAREAGWAVVNKISPENGPKLRTYFAKE